MVWCKHCGKHVSGVRPFDSGLSCDLCGRVLEDYNFSSEVIFVKNAAGQSQASGNIVGSVETGISRSRESRMRIARDEFLNLRDALGIGDERADVIDMAVRFFTMAVDLNFTKGRRTELVQASCLYLTCREKKIPYLLIDFSSYLRVSVYELGSVYLELCHKLYIGDRWNYEKLVDPSIFIPRFSNTLLKGTNDKAVVETATHIIASMKRDWIQTGRKPSGICGAALYTAALSHGIKCSKTEIVNIVHICEATLTKRLTEFGNTDAAKSTVDELTETEKRLHKESFTRRPKSKADSVHCMHQECKPFGYGLCESCYDKFMTMSGGLDGENPPAFQRAVKENMEKEKAAREKNEGGVGSEQQCLERGEGKKDGDDEHAKSSDESGNFSDISDAEVDGYINNEEEKRYKKIIWEEMNREYLEEQAAKEAALKQARDALNASNSNCPDHARKLVEASKAAVTKSRKEKQQKRAEEAKNAPPPATAVEAVRRMLDKKRLSGLINYDVLEELFDTNPAEKSPKISKTETDMEKKNEEKKEVKSNEDGEEDEEGYVESYDMNTDFAKGEKLYEEEEEQDEDGYDFGLY